MTDEIVRTLEGIAAQGSATDSDVHRVSSLLAKAGSPAREAVESFVTADGALSSGRPSGWTRLLAKTVADHVLEDDGSPDELDEDEAEWLAGQLSTMPPDSSRLDVVATVVARAVVVDEGFEKRCSTELSARALPGGVFTDASVEQLRGLLMAGGATEGVSRPLANVLWRLHDSSDASRNAAAWGTYFASEMARHLLEDDESPGEIDDDEAEWLAARLEGRSNDPLIAQTLKAILAGVTRPHPEIERLLVQ